MGISLVILHSSFGFLSTFDFRHFLASPLQPELIAAAIRELRSDRALALGMAARGRQTVAEKFSLDRMVRNTIHIYRQVLSC